jgi:hypothetical protein
MPPTPSPSPIDVFVHTGPAEWWQILAALGPLAVLLAASIAAYVAWKTLAQKAVADDRSEWWKRTQWALDAVYSGDRKLGTVGLKVLKVLGESELAGDGELAVLEAAWEQPLKAAQGALPIQQAVPGAGSRDEHTMQVAAAQLRMVTDRRLRKPTPGWVKELAAEETRPSP